LIAVYTEGKSYLIINKNNLQNCKTIYSDALLSFTALATPAAPPTNDPRTPSSGRTGRIPPRFAIGSILLLFRFFVFKPILIFVLAFIAAQTAVAAALSVRDESLAVMRFFDIEMPINKFGLSLGGGSESHYQWRGLIRNNVRDNALCRVATDFDAKLRKIRRLALPVEDTDAANKRYVQQSVQDLKDRLDEIERRITSFQNNVQIILNEFEKKIRESKNV
ncbi:hypothetical protein ALC62_13802, partial [Cyphomyrmex costatus]